MRSETQYEGRGLAGTPEAVALYGAAPGSSRAIAELAGQIGLLADSRPPSKVPGAVASLLTGLLAEPELLSEAQQQPDPARYARHLLYADPLRRFSILALVWLPGQATPVHGHTAWGAMGLYRGRLEVTNYQLSTGGLPVLECHSREVIHVQPGQCAAVQPGLDDIHRISNCSGETAISIHVYGMDLLRDPASLNIVLSC
ncbi:MAG: cysteine dioxygenase family protein [Chromatiales bacterium]|nr:cysteine dioxygenase family protein [Chromatiales bacterium]